MGRRLSVLLILDWTTIKMFYEFFLTFCFAKHETSIIFSLMENVLQIYNKCTGCFNLIELKWEKIYSLGPITDGKACFFWEDGNSSLLSTFDAKFHKKLFPSCNFLIRRTLKKKQYFNVLSRYFEINLNLMFWWSLTILTKFKARFKV